MYTYVYGTIHVHAHINIAVNVKKKRLQAISSVLSARATHHGFCVIPNVGNREA